jgi:hypothetical protein
VGRHSSRSSRRTRIFRFGLLIVVVAAASTGADLLRARPAGEVVALPTVTRVTSFFSEDFERPVLPSPSPSPTVLKPTPTPTRTVRVVARAPVAPRRPIPNIGLVHADVDAIGDSVMAGAASELRRRISHIYVDAGVARQVSGGITVLRQLRDAHKLAKVVVIDLGSNGRFTLSQFEEIMKILSSVQRVVFVNLKVPRSWESGDNQVIAAGVRRHASKAVLVDWHNRWRDCPGQVFWSDAYHLTSAGARCYSSLVAAAVRT